MAFTIFREIPLLLPIESDHEIIATFIAQTMIAVRRVEEIDKG
jgi:hypothetical protein